jgi:hypothetical protein
MLGQSLVEPVWVRGVVVPPDGAVVPPDGAVVPPDGAVVAAGAGEADGSAARTTAVPPRTRSPTARAAVAIVRRMPPNDGAGADAGGGV